MNLLIPSVLSVVAVVGLAGGYAGYLLGPSDPGALTPEKRSWYLRRSLALGVVAAFMVPLFLQVVGSVSGNDANLLDNLEGPTRTLGMWLALVGFCLVAAVSSQRFIKGLTNKLLESFYKDVHEIKASQSEDRRRIEDLGEDLVDVAKVQNPRTPIPDLEKAVLHAVYSSSERRPKLDEIVAKGDWKRGEVTNALRKLEEQGLVRSRVYEDGQEGWRVRTAGKALVAIDLSASHPESKAR